MVRHHQVSSPCECRRMMRSKSLVVTRTSLTTGYARLCDSSRCNTYSLSKGLLIKYRWLVKCRWGLTSAPWMSSTSSSSTSHQHNQHGTLNSNSVSLRHKHSPETLIIHINQCICSVLAFTSNARQSILHLKYYLQQNFIFENFG